MRIHGFALPLLWLFALSITAAERPPVFVRMYSLSLRFHAASTTLAGESYSVEFTTDETFSEINGEWTPLYLTNAPTHGTYFRMRSPGSPEPITGRIAFDEPDPVDVNGNGFHDFYEASLPVSDTSFGVFATQVAQGTVRAVWSRAAGSATGTCRLQLTSAQFGQLPEFVHTFDLIEYTGTLVATPGPNTITASLALKQTGKETNTLSAALAFSRVATNRVNALVLLPGSFLTSSGQVLLHHGGFIERDQQSRTNYFGFLELADADLTTRIEDYFDWVVSIDDPNDTNSNGIPDLSDDPAPLSSTPTLSIQLTADKILLSVQGETGRTYVIEQSGTLAPAQWTLAATVTLTANSQSVELAKPAAAAAFWRVRAANPASGPVP